MSGVGTDLCHREPGLLLAAEREECQGLDCWEDSNLVFSPPVCGSIPPSLTEQCVGLQPSLCLEYKRSGPQAGPQER